LKKLLIGWAFLAYGIAHAQNAVAGSLPLTINDAPVTVASATPIDGSAVVPAGAVALGYLHRAIYLAPTTNDISYAATSLKNKNSGN